MSRSIGRWGGTALQLPAATDEPDEQLAGYEAVEVAEGEERTNRNSLKMYFIGVGKSRLINWVLIGSNWVLARSGKALCSMHLAAGLCWNCVFIAYHYVFEHPETIGRL